MRDINGVEHTICPGCYALATPYVGLQETSAGRVLPAFVGDVRMQSNEDVARLADDPTSVWKRRDRLVANMAAQQHTDGIEWHVRLLNLNRKIGIRIAILCHMPQHAVEVAGVQTFDQYAADNHDESPEPDEHPAAPSWREFIAGQWRRVLPTRPGVYPVRQVYPGVRPACFPVIRADVSSPRGKKARMVYVGMDGAELRPSGVLLSLWVWSEPIPPLPEPVEYAGRGQKKKEGKVE